jgi:hypothetical protein
MANMILFKIDLKDNGFFPSGNKLYIINIIYLERDEISKL